MAELAEHGLLALPRARRPRGRARASGRAGWAPRRRLTAEGADGGVDAEVVDGEGRVFVRLEGYRTIELPQAVDEALLAPLRAVASAG